MIAPIFICSPSLRRFARLCPGHPRLFSRAAKTWMPGIRPGMTVWLELAKQAAETLDAVVDAAAAQRVPDDRLERRHHVDAELALERIDRPDGRPVRRRQQDRVGIGMRALELAPHLQRRVNRDAADLVERAAPAGRAQHLAAEMA